MPEPLKALLLDGGIVAVILGLGWISSYRRRREVRQLDKMWEDSP